MCFLVRRPGAVRVLLLLALCGSVSATNAATHRLYDGLTVFVNNPDGVDFNVALGIRDTNHRISAPSELLVKVYPPDGKPVVREIVPDDGVIPARGGPPAPGWDHEAWYYATCYSRGLEPLVPWSAFSDPARLAAIPARTRSYAVNGGQKGVYRLVVVGSPDHYVDLAVDKDLAYGIAGNPEWLHGHHELLRRAFIYVPRTTKTIDVLFLQLDEPARRTFSISDADGQILCSGDGADGLVQTSIACDGQRDEQILTLEISDGPGDFIINVTHQVDNEFTPVRSPFQAVTAVLCPDADTARAIQGGAIYHDGEVLWQMHQMRLHDWLAKLQPADFEYPAELGERAPGFVSVGSHNAPKPGSADIIMDRWARTGNGEPLNPNALNAALRDMLYGMRLIGPGDHVAIGPKRNLAYEMGCYTYFWWRPAWRLIQQSSAPGEVKDILREYVVQGADRLAFARTAATGNGNAFGSLMAALRYCQEASGDPLQQETFDTVWERFANGGYGDRVGLGPSGGLQESMGYDYHYGSYVLRGWRAINHDIKDPRMVAAYNRMLELYSYIHFQGGSGNPWSSRTSAAKKAGGTYDPWHAKYGWKGFGGPNFTISVNDANEWFAARRQGYYAVTYHGRLTPTWEGEGFHGQIGLGGGTLCHLAVPGKGQVLGGKPSGSYGKGMHASQWRGFHVHGLVGTTADGQPLVAANSEHFNARLDGATVVGSGPVRQSSVTATRRYTFADDWIECEISLSESHHDNVYSLWGGRPGLRGKVKEAYEMIPFEDLKKLKKKPRPQDKRRTRVVLLEADGSELAELTDAAVGQPPRRAAAVRVDRRGYGAVIEFDETRPVERGRNDTLLVQLVTEVTPASSVAFSYRIVPYSGEPPKPGELAADAPALPMPGIAAGIALAEVAGALADQPTHEIKRGDQVVGAIRVAMAGGTLALTADVVDAKPHHDPTPWKGSCLEIFGSQAAGYDIGQLFLAPAAGDMKARGYRAAGGKQIPDATIAVQSSVTETGYSLQALVPASLLLVDPAKDRFIMELQVSSATPNGQRGYHNLFGSVHAYENNSKYGVFRVER